MAQDHGIMATSGTGKELSLELYSILLAFESYNVFVCVALMRNRLQRDELQPWMRISEENFISMLTCSYQLPAQWQEAL